MVISDLTHPLSWAPDIGVAPLLPGENRIWLLDLPQLAAQYLPEFEADLSVEEQAQAHRMATAQLCQKYIASHAGLRRILTACLAPALLHTSQLQFSKGKSGKPYLPHFPELHYNLSHSGHLALVAVSRAAEVGIDVEEIRSSIDFNALAPRFFSLLEQAALRQIPAARRLEAFYNTWTCKEAVLKACGEGLTIPLHLFAVQVDPTEAPGVLAWQVDRRGVDAFKLYALALPTGYVGCLALCSALDD